MASAIDYHSRHLTHENILRFCRTQPQVRPSQLSAYPRRPDSFEQRRGQSDCYLTESAHRSLDPSILGADLISDWNGSEVNDRVTEWGTHALRLAFQANIQLP